MSGASITKTPTSTSASPRSAILLRLSAAARYARGLQEAGNWRSEPTAAKCAAEVGGAQAAEAALLTRGPD
jgi:hypothetical protein